MASKESADHKGAFSKEDLRKVEQSLFADASSTASDTKHANYGTKYGAEEEESIGLLTKPKRTGVGTEEGAEEVRKAIFKDVPIGEDKDVVLKFNPSRVKQRLKKGLFWLLIIVLVVSFFYNPFYQYFPWNKQDALTGAAISDDDTENTPAAGDEQAAAGPADQDEAPAKKEAAKAVSPVDDVTDESADTGGTEKDKPVSADEENTNDTTDDSAASATAASSAAPKTLTFTITNVEVLKTTYGWKVGKVSFEIDNNKEVFPGKLRARGYNGANRRDIRSDKNMKLGELQLGQKYTNTIELNAQFDKAGEKLVLLELIDDGDESGSANDRRMASIEKSVTVG